ncbi:LYR motif-containing 4 [Brachionus plicatilis]|uniref:LYR motif-containing 4 n=1 Tax=Brachionus plicatilis TaxID=10195 RepID=A0A3M7SP20_BRAPC|nr:LYR motif-containing 4 [Brachionus plicatilis]
MEWMEPNGNGMEWECFFKNAYPFRSIFRNVSLKQEPLKEYAKKRIKYEFEASKSVSDPVKQAELIERANKNLDMIKRQVLISQMYPVEKLVIE